MEISDKNYALASNQFTLSSRPYLYAFLEESVSLDSKSGIFFGGGTLNLKNVGGIPASIINAEYHVISNEMPDTDLMGWFKKDLGGFPYVKVVFPQGSVPVPLHPMIGRKPKLVFVSAIITYTGIDPSKVYWYKFIRLFYMKKLRATPIQFAFETLKAEEDWDRNGNFTVPNFEKPDWAFYLKNRE